MKSGILAAPTDAPGQAFHRRRAAGLSLIPLAETLAATAQAMAQRFNQGGRLLTLGHGASQSDAHHVAVEFVHPVIVGKRSLPALALEPCIDLADPRGLFDDALRLQAKPTDMVLAVTVQANDDSLVRALRTAHDLRLLTVALTGPTSHLMADHLLRIEADDPLIIKEVQVTTYHILWELVHLYLG